MSLQVKVFIIFVFVTISLMGLAVYDKQRNESNTPQVYGIADYSNYPVIQNIAPNIVGVGKYYEYSVGVIDSDTHPANLRLYLKNAPSWLTVSGLILSGTPTTQDLGTNKVEIEVNDGEHSTYKTFYILVTLPNETE